MKRQSMVFSVLSAALLLAVTSRSAVADTSHARIVRLSLVQGDVRFAEEYHKDALTDDKATWEVAPLNLPIRQGNALATDNSGRAEVEFENGAMAFLSANTLIEFYDLSLSDGAHITRLILRQGSAIFYVHPANGDYFSVTGGDFSVEANGRTTFRIDNFDDGSAVKVEQGHVAVLRNKESKPLEKGQSYAIDVNGGGTPVIARGGNDDDFDKWVSGRINSVATATAYSSQYVNSPNYSAGFADLYNYGSFYNVPGYGFGWQPFGMGVGWCPFDYGNWYFNSAFGWNFIGSAPWGWLPYHYGGWVFSPAMGWVWIPSGLGFGGPVYYRPVTAVWGHSGATTGLVPLHPADGGKTPLNLVRGVYPVKGNTIAAIPTTAAGEKWSVLKRAPREALAASTLAATTPPTHVSRTILSRNSGSRPVTLSRDSSIVYDPSQHRFVNGNQAVQAPRQSEAAKAQVGSASVPKVPSSAAVAGGSSRPANGPAATRGSIPPRPSIAPPRPPSSSYPRTSGGATWNNSRGSGSSGSSGSSTSAPRASAPASSPAASGHPSAAHH